MRRRIRRARTLVPSVFAAGIACAFPSSGDAQLGAIEEHGYLLGDPDAPIEVVEFADFGCSACGTFARDVWPGILADFVATGRVRWRYIPIHLGGLPRASEAVRAAECAAEQEDFWAMHDLLYERQREWQRERRPEGVLALYAATMGLDVDTWRTCYRGDGGRDRIRENNRAARRLRVRGTPTFFVNGRRVEGAPPRDQFREILTRAGSLSG